MIILIIKYTHATVSATVQFIIFLFLVIVLLEATIRSDSTRSTLSLSLESVLSPLNSSIIDIFKHLAKGSINEISGKPMPRSHLETVALDICSSFANSF